MIKVPIATCLLLISASAFAEEQAVDFVLPKLEKSQELEFSLEEGFLVVDGIRSLMPETQLSQDTYDLGLEDGRRFAEGAKSPGLNRA